MRFVFPPSDRSALEIVGLDAFYPIERIFCVGRNYAAHAAEMGGTVDRESPWFFTKFPSAFRPSGSQIPYPPGTADFHFEMELAVALGGNIFKGSKDDAASAVFGYGCGLDLTRRDRQQEAKDTRRPWDVGKNFENSAILAPLTPKSQIGPLGDRRIHLAVNSVVRQDAKVSDMVWSIEEIISHLSHLYHLGPGDIILTGTPSGVGSLAVGDQLIGGIDGLDSVQLEIGQSA